MIKPGSASLGNIPIRVGYSPACTAGGCGRCASMPDMRPRRSRTSAITYLFKQGQKGLSVAFDLPTQIGYDADHPLALGEVGKVGVSICSLDDMEALFRGIPLEDVSTSMTINAPGGRPAGALYRRRPAAGGEVSRLRGTLQNDILKEYIARGTYIFPLAPRCG